MECPKKNGTEKRDLDHTTTSSTSYVGDPQSSPWLEKYLKYTHSLLQKKLNDFWGTVQYRVAPITVEPPIFRR